jgi:hypothetical protein
MTECRKMLPDCLIQKPHAIERHRCDWRKKTGEAMAREWAKQSEEDEEGDKEK